MINAPQVVIDALNSDNFKYANLVTINLGDAYGSGSDVILYLTDCGHNISFGGNTYTPDNNLSELAGISRKASTGSDSVDVVFSVTDANLIDVIRSERYINKPTSIDRVILNNGAVVGDFAIPVRTAWGLSHSISGDIDDRSITLTIDSTLGDLDGDNGWYAVTSSHTQRYPNDLIMRHSQTVMTEEQQKKYTTNFRGEIDSQIKPPALAKVYGYKNVECIPICMLKHRKSHTSYRHYFTTMIYAINIGDCDFVDINSLKMDDEPFDGKVVTNTKRDIGGWSVRVRTPTDALTGDLLSEEDNGDLSFWFEGMDTSEKNRMQGMYGKGLTLLFVKNRNRDDWLNKPPKFTLPVRGAKVYDPRSGQTVFSRNPALQYADYLKSSEYGAGKRGIPVTDSNIITLADHFDQIPDSIGNAGINSILIDVQVDTGKPIVDNMNIWMEGTRLYTSDYYGEFNIRVETKSAVNLIFNEDDDLIESPDYDSGEFTKRLNQLTYSIKQLVPDTSPDAEVGDLTEVEVEATFPPDGSQIHVDWLAEDGGIVNFESEQLNYVTVLEQAFYWAMVDARISREPRTMTIKPPPICWLTEVGDVIQFSSTVMDMTDELWRVDEVTEDEGQVELSLIAYDNNFYTPDPDAIPDPAGVATPPTGISLSPVSGLSLKSIEGFYYLDWLPLSSENVSWYAVEIEDGNQVLIVDEPRVAQPPLLLPSITVGDYQATVTAMGFNNESDPSVLLFTLGSPEIPTINVTLGNFSIEVYPEVVTRYIGNSYELLINNINDIATAQNKGISGAFTIANLNPDTTYYLWVRTINITGESDWATTSVTTLNDNTVLVEFLDLDIPSIIDDVVVELQDNFTDIQQTTVDIVAGIWENYQTGEDVATETHVRKTEKVLIEAEIAQTNASIETTNQVVANLDAATATRIVQLQSLVDANTSEITRVDQTYADETTAIAQSVTTLETDVQNNYASITYTNQAVSDEASARATAITQLETDVAGTYATVTNLNSVSIDVNGNANALSGIRTAVSGADDQAQTELILQTNMDAVTNEVIGKAMLGVTTGGVFTGMTVVGGVSYNGIEFRADVFKLSDSVGNPQLSWDNVNNAWFFNGRVSASGGTFRSDAESGASVNIEGFRAWIGSGTYSDAATSGGTAFSPFATFTGTSYSYKFKFNNGNDYVFSNYSSGYNPDDLNDILLDIHKRLEALEP